MEGKTAEILLSEALKKNYDDYKETCEKVSTKYLSEAERLAELADEREAVAKLEQGMQMVEHATNLSSGLPEAIRHGGRLEQALNQYKQIMRKVSGHDMEDGQLDIAAGPHIQRFMPTYEQHNDRVTHSMLRCAQIGKRMELVLCCLTSVVLLAIALL